MPSTPLIRLICFGDSLTAGFQSPTKENPHGDATPYGAWLQQWMGSAAVVVSRGICGELTGEMRARFHQDVLRHRPHLAVILGGTNDLGWGGTPAQIMRNLIDMYERLLAHGGRPVPVTVPSLRVGGDKNGPEAREWLGSHLDRRRDLNARILEYAAANGLTAIDLFTATAEPDTGLLAATYSNDGLHLTTAGYRLFADLVYRHVLKPTLLQGGQVHIPPDRSSPTRSSTG